MTSSTPHDQGAQPSPFIPPDSDVGGAVTAIAINDPGRDDSHIRIHATGYGVHAQIFVSGNSTPFGSGSGFGPAIIKPIILRTKEGLGALANRSKSAPPVPRDQVGGPPSSQSGVAQGMEPRQQQICCVVRRGNLQEDQHTFPRSAQPRAPDIDLRPGTSGTRRSAPNPDARVRHTPGLDIWPASHGPCALSNCLSYLSRGMFIEEGTKGCIWRWGDSKSCCPCFRGEREGVQE
jgi:hypothetical protein